MKNILFLPTLFIALMLNIYVVYIILKTIKLHNKNKHNS